MKGGVPMHSENIYDAIRHFKFSASPSNSDSSAPATVGDIKKLIDEIAKLAEAIAESKE